MGKSAEMMRAVRLVVANVDIEGSNARYGFGPYSSSAFGMQFGVGMFSNWMRGGSTLLNSVNQYISAVTYHNLLCSPFTSELFTLDMPTICETRFFLLPAPPQPLTSAPSADPAVASQLDPIATNQLPNPDYPPPLSPSPLPAPLHLLIFQQVLLQKKRRMLRVTLEKLWAIVWLKTVGLPCPFRVREYKECAAKKCLCLLLLIRQQAALRQIEFEQREVSKTKLLSLTFMDTYVFSIQYASPYDKFSSKKSNEQAISSSVLVSSSLLLLVIPCLEAQTAERKFFTGHGQRAKRAEHVLLFFGF
ncbi:hypothetical protein F5879DRAFT_922867 [Lentinula edodes]|nr:hypothetical protein F5879DRAFT_922867 [Lentinula edodes]